MVISSHGNSLRVEFGDPVKVVAGDVVVPRLLLCDIIYRGALRWNNVIEIVFASLMTREEDFSLRVQGIKTHHAFIYILIYIHNIYTSQAVGV